jgi:hypothetical protein
MATLTAIAQTVGRLAYPLDSMGRTDERAEAHRQYPGSPYFCRLRM